MFGGWCFFVMFISADTVSASRYVNISFKGVQDIYIPSSIPIKDRSALPFGSP